MTTLFVRWKILLISIMSLAILIATGGYLLTNVKYDVKTKTEKVLNSQSEKVFAIPKKEQRQVKPSSGANYQNEYYVEYRLERERARSQQIDLLREIVNNQSSPEETKNEAQRRLLAMTQAMDMEMKLENLIRAENFKDAVAFIQEKTVTVIVQIPVLTDTDKTKITQMTARITGLNPQNVSIITKA